VTGTNTAIDRLLEMLRAAQLPYVWHERHLNRWNSCCPRCLSGTWDLTIIDHGLSVALRCRGGCTEPQIVEALKRRPALLATQAREKAALGLAEAASEIAHRALDELRQAYRETEVVAA
jgi:hypothetical protein